MSAALSSLVTLRPSSSSCRRPCVPLMHLQGIRGVGSIRISCRNSHSTKIFSQQSGSGTEVVLETKNADNKSADTIEKANGAVTDTKEDVKTDKEQGDSFSSAVVRGFEDPRWKNGTWDLLKFTKDGKVDWDAVIDAEVYRRKMLEQNPEASTTDNPVVFDTSIVPWWAWMKRFHLPEAELLNGRAAMVGFFMAYFIDSLTGVGIVDQTSSFFGKLFLFIAVVGVLVVRRNEDLETVKNLIKESTFYDKQWQATWQNQTDQKDQDKK